MGTRGEDAPRLRRGKRMKMERKWKKCLRAAAAAAVLCLLLCTCAAAEETAPPAGSGLQDVKISNWARKEVQTAYSQGWVPDAAQLGGDYTQSITRAQYARLAVYFIAAQRQTTAEALLEENALTGEITDSPFSDTADPYILLAAGLGIVKGDSGGTFRPDGKLNRAEAAIILQRCMGLLGRTDANQAPAVFSDAYQMPRWAVEAIKFTSGRTTAAGKAVMSGSGGAFHPKDNLSIEQAVITLLRCGQSAAVETVYEGWRNAPGYDTVSITMSFGGDCTFGRSRNASYAGSFDEMYDKKGAAYFFSNVKEFHTDDLTMVNFEGALTTYNVPRENKEFIFKGRAAYAKILEAGSVDVVTIANNHARDYGNRGLTDTINNLSPYVAVSGYERMPIVTVKGVKVGFASNLGWSFDAAQKKFITDAIRSLRARGAEVIVFNYHWGEERQYKSNATQRAIAHYCIDQGADLVIGHHPHVVQEVETYKGKQIAYSLGNLSFGGNRNPSDKNCLIFQETFTLNLTTRKISASSYKALPYKVSSVSYRNDYRPTPA